MKECFVVLFSVGLGFFIGIMILIYPSGPAKWVLKKWALSSLQSPYLKYYADSRPLPWVRCTWLEWLEALAEDPLQAIEKCQPWQFWINFVVGIIWLLVTGRAAMLIKPVCWPLLQSWLQG